MGSAGAVIPTSNISSVDANQGHASYVSSGFLAVQSLLQFAVVETQALHQHQRQQYAIDPVALKARTMGATLSVREFPHIFDTHRTISRHPFSLRCLAESPQILLRDLWTGVARGKPSCCRRRA